MNRAKPSAAARALAWATPGGRYAVWRAAALCGLCIAAACAPSRSELFDPVRRVVHDRSGVSAEWREASRLPSASERKLRELAGRPLSARSAAWIAVLANPELQAAYAQLGIAGAAVARAASPSNPEFDAELTFPLHDEGRPQIELSVLEDISALIAMIPEGRAADAELEAARRRAAATTLEIAATAKRRFYEALAAEQQLKLRTFLSNAAHAAAELARGLRAAGNISEFELLRETVFEEESRLLVRDAEVAAAARREALGVALGLPPSLQAALQLPERFDPLPERAPNAIELERAALEANLELAALRHERNAAEHNVGLARLQSFLPHLGLGVAVKREDEWRVGPAVSLTLPLFDFGTAKRAAAWARLRGLEQHYQAAELRTRAAAHTTALAIAAAHDRAFQLETRVLPMRAQLLDQALRQYNAMNLDAFMLLSLRREHASAQERYIEALRDYFITQTDLELLQEGAMPSEAMPRAAGDGHLGAESQAAAERGH